MIDPEVTEDQALLSKWLTVILAERHFSTYKAAQETGISKTQLGRYLKPEPGGSMPSLDYLKRIAGLAPHIPPPEGLLPHANGATHPGFREPDVTLLNVDDKCPVEMKPKTSNQSVWRLGTRAIEMPPHAYLPCDFILLDQSVKPRAGQAVCAQIYDRQGGAEMVFRAWEPPHLVIATNDPKVPRAPIYVDGDKVVIMGTVIRSLRVSEG